MGTFKRVDGDYSIVTLNPGDVVNLDTSQVTVTGNLAVGGNTSIDNVTVTNANIAGNVTAGFFYGDGGGLANISASSSFANVVKHSVGSTTRIRATNDTGNISVDINGVANVTQFGAQGVESVGFIGPLAGDVTGSVTGDLFGSVLKEDSTVLVDANTETHYGTFVGDLTGNVTGDILGNISGNITGNIASAGNLGISGANIVLSPTGNVVMANGTIGNVPTPVLAGDVATKLYVDTMTSTGVTVHTPVRLKPANSAGSLNATYAQGGTTHTVTSIASGNTVVMSSSHSLAVNDVLRFVNSFNGITGNLPYLVYSTPAANSVTLSSQYNGTEITGLTNGTGLSQPMRANSGVGATLTNAGTLAALTVDGVTANVNDRILLVNQTNALENGVYTVTNTGNASVAWVLTRSTDTDTYAPEDVNALDAGDYFYIQAGNTSAGESYVMTAPVGPFMLGYTGLTFTQFSAAQVYSAGNGIVLTGTTFSVNAVQSLTSVTTTGNVTASGNISASYFLGNGSQLTGVDATQIVSGTSNVKVSTTNGNIAATVGGVANVVIITSTGANIAGTLNATGNANVGNIGATLFVGNLSGTGNSNVGNLGTTGLITASGNITGSFFIGNGSQLTGISADSTQIVSGTSNVKVTTSGGNIAVTVGGTANVGVFTTGGLTLGSGNLSAGNIVNNNSNGVGNIGSSTTYFNTVFAKATSAQYADVAELYRADAYYAPGTVLEFGGAQEVTKCLIADSSAVAGVVSQAPAYLMNSGLEHDHVVALALLGRVKCWVRGPVSKGDLLVSAGDGAARTNNQAHAGTIIGKSLENAADDGLVEIVVGKH